MPSTNRLTIREENLRRNQNEGLLHYLEVQYPGTTAASWKFGKITKVDRHNVRFPWYFAASSEDYVIFSIDILLENNRIRAREVIREVWDHYRGSLASLNSVGYWYVTNTEVRSAMTNASYVLRRTQQVLNVWNSIVVGSSGWAELETNNVFIIGLRKMLEENADETGNAVIVRVDFFWEPKNTEVHSNDTEDYGLYMKIHLGR
ncbi:hypothetical protein SLS62_010557 [Diatrype stigma]|uniref:Uncharacterized protein n=1 Tax=Diatrype stigma TaxID=117547 RepID=A0AAN9UGG3_9PEZI